MFNEFDFVSNIKVLDDEHFAFFANLKKLKTALENNESKEVILKLIKKVDLYASEHFEHEEGIAQKCNFTRLNDLKESHSEFKETYRVIHKVYNPQKENICRVYALHVVELLYSWVLSHYEYVESELIQHLKKCKEEGLLDIE